MPGPVSDSNPGPRDEFDPPPWAYDAGIHHWYDGATDWWFFPTFDRDGDFLDFHRFATKAEAEFEYSRIPEVRP